MQNDTTTAPTLTTLLEVRPPALPETVGVMTVLIELPPGAPVDEDEPAALDRREAA